MNAELEHADRTVYERYAQGLLAPDEEARLEVHLVGCARCQDGAAAAVASLTTLGGGRRLESVWDAIDLRTATPTAGPLERVLRVVGLAPETARLIAAAPSLRLPWLATAVGTLAFAVLAAAAGSTRGAWLFLAVAPLLPVAGVVGAYGQDSDPVWEVTRAAPYSMTRLTLLRTATVVAAAVPLTTVAGLVLPGTPWWIALVWLAPATLFTTLALLASTSLEPTKVVAALAVAWGSAVAVAAARRADPLVLGRPEPQLFFLLLTVLAGGVLFTCRERLATGRWRP